MFCFRKAIISLILVFILQGSAFCEIITLDSGQEVRGSITQETERYIEIDVGLNEPIRFYREEIKNIQSDVTEKTQDNEPEESVENGRKEKIEQEVIDFDRSNKDFLWMVKSPEAIVYLYGSIHLGRADMYPLSEDIEKAFGHSTSLAVEVNINEINPAVVQQSMMSKALYKGRDKLENNLSKETLIKLRKRMRQYGLYVAQFSQFKPWFIAILLMDMQVQQLGFDKKKGLDLYFLKKAKNSKNILELETLEQQISLFDDFQNQEEILEHSLISMDEIDKIFNDMIEVWKNGDADAMNEMIITKPLEEYPHFLPVYNSVFFDRNADMTEKIKGYLNSEGNYFVVVGAGHLIGDKGIVQLLIKDGYDVEQL